MRRPGLRVEPAMTQEWNAGPDPACGAARRVRSATACGTRFCISEQPGSPARRRRVVKSEPMGQPHQGIFPTFFLSGFECSTFLWKDGRRRDLVAETCHREHAVEDYRLLHDLGIAVAREGIPWPLVDQGGGRY